MFDTDKLIYLCRHKINRKMKNLLTLIMAAGMFAFIACGPSAEEKAVAEQATADSIAAAEAAVTAEAEAAAAEAAAAEMATDTVVVPAN